MREGFVRFNFLRLVKYIECLEKQHAKKRTQIKQIKTEYLKKVSNFQMENQKELNQKNKMINELTAKLQNLKQECEIYENKLSIGPNFIVNKFNK